GAAAGAVAAAAADELLAQVLDGLDRHLPVR
ncbi:MAG: hypothetical protein AVDCRST_MAG41-2213, partial [uncultured Corynebacteriales bacterium]